ncbi:MAG: IMPACT family protein [Candidatus Caldatribacteriaceae bacterium]
MRTIERETQVELVVERSRFIALSFRLASAEEGKKKLKEAQNHFPGATHFCYAFRLSEKEEFSSDGGEPVGSAGRPILSALRHFDLFHTMVVVVRSFGGKKLGIRGLAEAYGEAARMVLQKSEFAECRRECLFLVEVDPQYENLLINRLLALARGKERLALQGEGKFSLRDPEEKRESIQEILARGQKEKKVWQFHEKEVWACDT